MPGNNDLLSSPFQRAQHFIYTITMWGVYSYHQCQRRKKSPARWKHLSTAVLLVHGAARLPVLMWPTTLASLTLPPNLSPNNPVLSALQQGVGKDQGLTLKYPEQVLIWWDRREDWVWYGQARTSALFGFPILRLPLSADPSVHLLTLTWTRWCSERVLV